MLSNNKSLQSRYSKLQPLRNYLTLDFKQDHTTFGRFGSEKQKDNSPSTIFSSTFYNTFNNKQIPKWYRANFSKSSNGRQTSMTNRDSIIGTLFRPIDFNYPENNARGLPSLDLKRYQYLLKTVSLVSKSKKASQIRELARPKASGKGQTENKEIASPKVLNLQVEIQQKGRPFFKAECENAFQKMFKNKQLLLRGRHSPTKEHQVQKIDAKIFGYEGLRVTHMPKQPQKHQKTLVK